MDLIVAWLALPALLALLCCGCGLLVGAVPGVSMPRAVVPACGFALIVVAGQALVSADATAELATPAIVALAVGGLFLGRGQVRRPPALAPLLAAVAVFCVFAAPIVLSGEATFAGFIRLDDTATWLALTDRVMEHGRNLEGLAPSSYEATLAFNLGDGYPVGVFVPLGVAAALLGTDPAWLIQPYMAVIAALLVLALWSLSAPLVRGRGWRVAIAAGAAQPALLYGYYLWGGVKELAAAALIATAAALAASLRAEDRRPTGVIPLAVVCGALIAVLSGGGLLWLAPILLGAGVELLRGAGPPGFLRAAAVFAVVVAIAAIPVAVAGGLLPPTSSPLTDDAAQGNLITPLALEQVLGIWPSGDFRLTPEAEAVTYVLLALAAALVLVGLVSACAARARGPLLYLSAVLAGAIVILAFGSPWVDGKALATASPALLFAALLGGAALARVSRVAAAACVAVVLAGVVWSNALAYRDVSLAPRAQLEELEEIAGMIAGEGPTLMTEYNPYGVRHFLRDAEPEGVSELRRRTIPRTDGSLVEKGEAVDTDQLDPGALLAYRTLVLRRSPVRSRPPFAYERVWAGDTYEVWQRPKEALAATPRIALGGPVSPAARPDCAEVEALGQTGDLLAARPGRGAVIPLARADYPASWAQGGDPDQPRPRGAGSIVAAAELPAAGEYELWLGGSVRPAAAAFVDGDRVGTARHELNNRGGFVTFGRSELAAGPHVIEIRFGESGLHPGSGGAAPAVGPVALSLVTHADPEPIRVAGEDAARLCGRRWDWIESTGRAG